MRWWRAEPKDLADDAFTDTPKAARFFEDGCTIRTPEARNPIRLRRQFSGSLRRGPVWFAESQIIVGRIEIMSSPSDPIVAILNFAGGSLLTFPPVLCLRISVLRWIIDFIVIES